MLYPALINWGASNYSGYDISVGTPYVHQGSSTSNYDSIVLDDGTIIVAYSGVDNDGFIKVFTYDESTDTFTEESEIEHDTSLGTNNKLIYVSETLFILAYSGGASTDGIIKTFSIDTSTSYNITEVESVVINTTGFLQGSGALIASGLVALCYGASGNDGFTKLYSFDSDGTNLQAEGSALEFDAVFGYAHETIACEDDYTYINFYRGESNDGWAKSFSVNPATFAITETDSFEFDAASTFNTSGATYQPGNIILLTESSGGDSWMQTFQIDSNGDNITLLNRDEFDTGDSDRHQLVLIDSNRVITTRDETANAQTIIESWRINTSNNMFYLMDSYTFSVDTAITSLAKYDANRAVFCFSDGASGELVMIELS